MEAMCLRHDHLGPSTVQAKATACPLSSCPNPREYGTIDKGQAVAFAVGESIAPNQMLSLPLYASQGMFLTQRSQHRESITSESKRYSGNTRTREGDSSGISKNGAMVDVLKTKKIKTRTTTFSKNHTTN